jgi:hypothetical protein
MIGLISKVYGPSIEELLDLYRTQMGCSDKKFRNMRKAAVAAATLQLDTTNAK